MKVKERMAKKAQAWIPEELYALARLVEGAGVSLYAVGGLPRNAQLGLPPSDMDICSAMTPSDMAALCRRESIRCIEKAPAFGTVEIHMGDHIFEHTTFRGESYGEGGGHRPMAVKLGALLTEDAFRRDFTCNALYLHILSGKLLNPTGGIKDVRRRLVRATNEDPSFIMRHDGLRVLRLVRFAVELGFDIDKPTWDAAKAHVGGLADIAWERRRDELSKILLSDVRYPTLVKGKDNPVLRGLFLLHGMGALPHLLPALLEGDGVPQRPRFHAYDVLRHNFHACAYSAPTLTLRLAALLHDVGKPAALREKGLDFLAGGHEENPVELPQGVTPMLHHDTLGVPMAQEMLKALRYPNQLIEDVLFLIQNHMYDLNFQARTSTLRTRFATLGYERSVMLCEIREADVRGSGYSPDFIAVPWRRELERMRAEGAPFSLEELNCTGRDIMEWLQIPAGETVGNVKQRMLLHCARHPKDNTKVRLQKLAKGMR